MWTDFAILGLVTLQRLVELHIARRNTKRLIANGGVEVSSGHYPFIVIFHAIWLTGLWYSAWSGPLVNWTWAFAYLVLQAARGWIIAALGSRWTTRIIVVPGETLVSTGPYKFFRHPNYMIVAAEIFILPMVFGKWWYAIIFGCINLALLYWRVTEEERALKPLREDAQLPEDSSV
jgi:methyltransferase